MTVQGQARTGNVPGPGVPGVKSGQTPGVREVPPPEPGELAQTPWEIEGPYYRLGTPRRSNLLEPGDKPEFILNGRVLTPEGRPIAGALVNFWHCNRDGDYDMVGYRYTGYVVTDEAGRYELTTIVPGAYQPRQAKHVHVKVQAISRPVTTQLFLEGEPGNAADDYYNPALFVPCRVDADGVKHGTFDFVIAQFTEEQNVTPESLTARA
ncbi:MAG TPA: dioxygenase [Trebonia sp.]|jgi:protocatechuate 3,4-dioxygenase beta subunit